MSRLNGYFWTIAHCDKIQIFVKKFNFDDFDGIFSKIELRLYKK